MFRFPTIFSKLMKKSALYLTLLAVSQWTVPLAIADTDERPAASEQLRYIRQLEQLQSQTGEALDGATLKNNDLLQQQSELETQAKTAKLLTGQQQQLIKALQAELKKLATMKSENGGQKSISDDK